ncbi:Uncharacterized protein Fot_22888 [Forsythia ovata]|uniref:Uncharacterized protein n=1 Tax=Forsythia ovata TaxID=205694 RepID=A0ABD1UZB9_9LAMI
MVAMEIMAVLVQAMEILLLQMPKEVHRVLRLLLDMEIWATEVLNGWWDNYCQSPSGAPGYGNQGYGYGGYGGNDRTYGNQAAAAAYGAFGGRTGSGPNGSAPA